MSLKWRILCRVVRKTFFTHSLTQYSEFQEPIKDSPSHDCMKFSQ